MRIIVLKFGGTSVGNVERIKKITKLIENYKKKKFGVIVVSSAMSGVTNDLIRKSKKLSKNFDLKEYDVLVSSGEQISCALISGYLEKIGYKSRSFMGWQVPIITDSNHGNSKILHISKKNVLNFLKKKEYQLSQVFKV